MIKKLQNIDFNEFCIFLNSCKNLLWCFGFAQRCNSMWNLWLLKVSCLNPKVFLQYFYTNFNLIRTDYTDFHRFFLVLFTQTDRDFSLLGSFYFSLALYLKSENRICCFDRTAARLEWSSFCEEERRAKKRERKAEIAAIKNKIGLIAFQIAVIDGFYHNFYLMLIVACNYFIILCD